MEANDLEGYLLKRKLFASTADKLERFRVQIVHRAQLNFNRLGGEIGETLLKLSIKDEGEIGVKFLLKLKELELLAGPRTQLVHGQNKLVRARVMRKRIKNTRMFQTVQW